MAGLKCSNTLDQRRVGGFYHWLVYFRMAMRSASRRDRHLSLSLSDSLLHEPSFRGCDFWRIVCSDLRASSAAISEAASSYCVGDMGDSLLRPLRRLLQRPLRPLHQQISPTSKIRVPKPPSSVSQTKVFFLYLFIL